MKKSIVPSIPPIFNCKPNPDWDVRKRLKKFETVEQAQRHRASLTKFLVRYMASEAKLIDALSKCRRGRRCALQACPECMRKARIWYCAEVAPLVADAPSDWERVSLVPDRFCYPEGELHRFNPQHLLNLLRNTLRLAGLSQKPILFGGIDYCVEVRDYKVFCSASNSFVRTKRKFWRPHLYLIRRKSDIDDLTLKMALEQAFPRSELVPRPISYETLYSVDAGILKPISYSFKSFFYARHSFSRTFNASKPKRKTKKQRMHGRDQAELASFLARQPLRHRLLLMSLKRVQQSIVLTSSFRNK